MFNLNPWSKVIASILLALSQGDRLFEATSPSGLGDQSPLITLCII